MTNNPQRPWGQIKLAEVIERKPGFYPANGYHIYCELRPVIDFEAADDDGTAAEYLSVIDRYANMGEEAARSYGIALLELQGRVLHFFHEREASVTNTDAVIDFAHEFTLSAYEELREDMGDDWHGFASAFDHGHCILINQHSQNTLSTVSLGPAANRPAKRLFTPSPAGCVSAPSRLVQHLRPSRAEWVDIELKNRAVSPTRSRLLMEKFSSIPPRVWKTDSGFTKFAASKDQDLLHWTPENPLRLTGAAVRCDLDGFSAMVERAFTLGMEQVALIARGFKEVMDYAETVARAHQPCIMLPWAGDCATFLLPEVNEPNQRYPRWLSFCMDWLASAINGSTSPLSINANLRGVKWGVGAARGESGTLVVAPTIVQAHRFIIAAGWPHATAKLAQESAKADQVAIDTEDHQQLVGAAKQIFDTKNDDDFWTADHPSHEVLQRKAADLGQTANRPHIVTTSKTDIAPPPTNRPYYPSNG